MGVSALSFVEYSPGLFSLEEMGINTDEELVEVVNKGTIGGSAQGVNIDSIFGGTEPESLDYDSNGANNILNAKITKWMYFLKEEKSN